MARRIAGFLHGLLTFAEVLLILAAMLYAGYSLWDNRQVYDQVENAMSGMREIKSLAGDEPLAMFDQLRVINRDVRAWIETEGTEIDYPVLQGTSNFSYLNTDVYGDFALLGSIFMDFRNAPDFSDPYTLLYGHDMSGHRMFSDVNLYKDEDFFRAHTRGVLTLTDGKHTLVSISCMVTGAGNSLIFNPQNWNSLTAEEMIRAATEGALYVNEETVFLLRRLAIAGKPFRIVTLSTCSGEYAQARTLLLMLMDPEWPARQPANQVGDCME